MQSDPAPGTPQAIGPLSGLGLASIKVIGEVAKERGRQVLVKGHAPQIDDLYKADQLPKGALSYVLAAIGLKSANGIRNVPVFWPWPADRFKPKNRRHDLIRAAAMIIAEVERMDRSTEHLEVT